MNQSAGQDKLIIFNLWQIRDKSLAEIAYLVLMGLVWSKDILLTYLRATILRIPFIWSFADNIIFISFVFFIVAAGPYIIKKIKVNDLIALLLFLLLYMVNMLIFPANNTVLNSIAPRLFFVVLPLYYLGISVDINKVIKILYYLSMITVVAKIAYTYIFASDMDFITSVYMGDMDAAYKTLPHICMVLYGVFKKANIINISISAAGILYLFSLGNRGSLLCLILYITLYIVMIKKIKRPFIIILICICVIIVLVFTQIFDTILNWLNEISVKMGLSTRIFEMYQNGEFFKSQSRNNITEKLFQAISERPFIGYGMGGDRTIAGRYAHNLVLEIWTQYGILMGSIFLIGYVSIIIRSFIVSTSVNVKAMILLLVCSSFIKLFGSGSYLSEYFFFFLLGVCINELRKNVKIKRQMY